MTACDHPGCPLDACIELAYIKGQDPCPHCRRPLVLKIMHAMKILTCRFCGPIMHAEEQ